MTFRNSDEVEEAILGFHVLIVVLLFLAASILILCGIAALVRSFDWKCFKLEDEGAYLIFVISFTQTGFLNPEFYTPKSD